MPRNSSSGTSKSKAPKKFSKKTKAIIQASLAQWGLNPMIFEDEKEEKDEEPGRVLVSPAVQAASDPQVFLRFRVPPRDARLTTAPPSTLAYVDRDAVVDTSSSKGKAKVAPKAKKQDSLPSDHSKQWLKKELAAIRQRKSRACKASTDASEKAHHQDIARIETEAANAMYNILNRHGLTANDWTDAARFVKCKNQALLGATDAEKTVLAKLDDLDKTDSEFGWVDYTMGDPKASSSAYSQLLAVIEARRADALAYSKRVQSQIMLVDDEDVDMGGDSESLNSLDSGKDVYDFEEEEEEEEGSQDTENLTNDEDEDAVNVSDVESQISKES